MMMQLQQQMMATQKLLQAQESENSKLQQEMERLARQKEADRAQEQRMAMERSMLALTRNMGGPVCVVSFNSSCCIALNLSWVLAGSGNYRRQYW